MSAPLAKGIIIAAGIIVAAGIAMLENEQIRIWLDERRRQLAVAFHDIGDNISRASSDRASDSRVATSAERRLNIVRRNRAAALIRRAREQGIAVDLDELAALTREPEMEQLSPNNVGFDDFLRPDGSLRAETQQTQTTGSAAQSATVNSTLRHRNAGARGLAAGSAFANPFDDEAQVMFDRDLIAPSEAEYPQSQPTTSTVRSLSPRPASTIPSVIDIPITSQVTQPQSQYKTDDEFEAEIQEAIRRSLQDAEMEEAIRRSLQANTQVDSPTQSAMLSPPATTANLSRSVAEDLAGLDESLYGFPSPRPNAHTTIVEAIHAEPPSLPADGTQTPRALRSGTLTPNSETSTFSSALSAALSSAATDARSETAVEESSQHQHLDVDMQDVRSLASDDEIFDVRSDAGMSEAAMSEAFSFVDTASTPGSWTDVDSDAENEEENGMRASRR